MKYPAYPQYVGWVEQRETQRQGLALLGFIAFNPAYIPLRGGCL